MEERPMDGIQDNNVIQVEDVAGAILLAGDRAAKYAVQLDIVLLPSLSKLTV